MHHSQVSNLSAQLLRVPLLGFLYRIFQFLSAPFPSAKFLGFTFPNAPFPSPHSKSAILPIRECPIPKWYPILKYVSHFLVSHSQVTHFQKLHFECPILITSHWFFSSYGSPSYFSPPSSTFPCAPFSIFSFFSVTGLRVTIPLQVRQMTTVRRKTSMMTTMMKALRDHQSLILGQV